MFALVGASPARAQDEAETLPDDAPEVLRLAQLAQQLGHEEAGLRDAARQELCSLGADELPAIRGRIARIRRGRPPRNWAVDIMNRFRRHGRPADGEGPPDLVEGAATELAQSHIIAREHQRVIAMAEPVMLWRALDQMGTLEAQRAIFGLIGLDEGLWMPEARNWVRARQGALMAASIHARRDGDRFVRRWGQFAYEELGADDPGRALPSLPPEQLPDVMEAYAEANTQSAMRVIVSYVGHPRRAVRMSARGAIERYGGNAIWILRTAHRNETGEHPPREWGWQHVAEAIYGHIDGRRMQPVREAIDAGIAARDRGDFDAMVRSFEDVLARMPEVENPGPMAEGYALVGAHELESGELERADHHYRRALRLAPHHQAAESWRAQRTWIRAEGQRREGIWDRAAHEAVVAAVPDHPSALSSLAAMSPPEAAAQPKDEHRTKWGIGAAVILALLGLALLWKPTERAPMDFADPEADTVDDTIDEADATLPDPA